MVYSLRILFNCKIQVKRILKTKELYKIMEYFSIESTRQKLDGGAMFGHAPKVLWSQWEQCDHLNRILIACRSLLVKTDNKILLFDTGVGNFMNPELSKRYGLEKEGTNLIGELKNKGIQEEDIDYVILSHLHFDHAGGLIPNWSAINSNDWALRFPNALYVVGKDQYKRSISPHPRDRASYIPALPDKLKSSKRLILLDPVKKSEIKEIKDYISFSFSNGHTPGLLHSTIKTEKETIFFCSDIIPGTSWINLPLASGYDRFPEQTVDEKKKIMDNAIIEHQLLFYVHDLYTVASHIIINDKGKYEASDQMKLINSQF